MRIAVLIMSVVAALSLQAPVFADDPAPDATITEHLPPKSLRKILAKGDGLTKETAYKVKSVRQEYEIVEYFGMRPGRQALVVDGKAYDVVTASDPETGKTREFWFDVSAFYRRLF